MASHAKRAERLLIAPPHERRIAFVDLSAAPLVVDAVYLGGTAGNVKDDPLSKIIPGSGNQGGFRAAGGWRFGSCRMLILYSSGEEIDWPDRLDLESGTFTYYGDNRKPGSPLHETQRGGNLLLRDMFAALESNRVAERPKIPPALVFSKAPGGRNVRFRGVAVPGEPGRPPAESLVAIWRQSDGRRFQNYRATFTILDAPEVPRSWITATLGGNSVEADAAAPAAWKRWRDHGKLNALRAPAEIRWRTQAEQEPSDPAGWQLLEVLRKRVEADPTRFEYLAVALFKLLEPNTVAEVTRPVVDGGRDAVGELTIGGELVGGIKVGFALEAKAYARTNSVGVREISRLISRIRHRQFGVLVTTSYLARQAYEEIAEDRHPIVVISGGDIVRLLRRAGIADATALSRWMDEVLLDAL